MINSNDLEELKKKEPIFLSKAKKTGYICPLCDNGAGKDGTGIIKPKNSNTWKCFKCGVTGDVIDWWGHYTNIAPTEENFTQRVNKLAEHWHMTIEEDSSFFKASEPMVDYLTSRGINAKLVIDKYNLHFKANHNGYNDPRILIQTDKGGYIARATNPASKDKVMNEAGKQVGLLGLKSLDTQEPIFITEGAFDLFTVDTMGYAGISLNGVSNTKLLIDELKSRQQQCVTIPPLLLLLDNDPAGKKATVKLEENIKELGILVTNASDSINWNSSKDINELWQANKKETKRILDKIISDTKPSKEEYQKQNSMLKTISAFRESVCNFDTPNIATGFSNLDYILDGGLRAGLYVIGAISSLGKTSFMLQVVDQIAKAGTDVIVFSLEMSKKELLAKSLSRLTYNLSLKAKNPKLAKTTNGLLIASRYDKYTINELELIEEAEQEYYNSIASRMYIYEGAGDFGIERITNVVEKHISITGNHPVVLIDYLQIIAPADIRATDKQNTDKAITELKRLSRDNKVAVLGISSFNRESYTAPVNLSSFKESGAIEYSADVLMGLQFAEHTTKNSKFFNIDEAKRDIPRKLKLRVLKNRNGELGDVYCDYDPRFNHFKEWTSNFIKAWTNEQETKAKEEEAKPKRKTNSLAGLTKKSVTKL